MGDKEEEEWSGSESGDYTSEDEGTEDYRRGGYHYESAILSRTDVTLSKASSVGAIFPPFGSRGTLSSLVT
ncbi:hypothetical protein V6N12_011698 [Hibiscus sabdariffa]|uniref:Uncharacterized protein n=1 Tax=Hibiscus sabdariffa TaxID=183260 RepID=A0ABR2B6H1_9ROSI